MKAKRKRSTEFAASPCSAWEYLVKHISGGPMPERELNKYGGDGWELCGIASPPVSDRQMAIGWPDVMTYTFKRQWPNREPNPDWVDPRERDDLGGGEVAKSQEGDKE